MFNLGFGSYNCSDTGAVCGPTVNIGKYSGIAQNCMFLGQGAHLSVINKDYVANYPFDDKQYSGNFPKRIENTTITIGNDVWIGFRTTVLNGVNIGDGAIIGAGTLVAKDVPPYAVFIGNPGQVHHYRFSPEIIEKLLKIKWWDWSDQIIRERIEDFKDINKFIEKYE